jgi:hypothetical protein
VGIGAKNEFIGRLSFWSNLLLEKKGWRALSTTLQRPERVVDVESTYTYLTYSFRPGLSVGRKRNILISFGPYVSRLLARRCVIREYINNLYVGEDIAFGLTDSRLYDVGLSFSTHFEFCLSDKVAMNIGLLNLYGLTDITSPKHPFASIFLNTTQLLIGFNIKR